MAAPEQPLPMSRGCQNSASLSPPRGDRTLLVRHLPAELTAEEKEYLLKYFGAQSVRVLSDKGRLVRAREPLVSGEGPRPVTWGREVLTEGKRRVGKMRWWSGGFLFPFPVFLLAYQNIFRPKSSFNWLVPRLVAALRKRAIEKGEAERMKSNLYYIPFLTHPGNLETPRNLEIFLLNSRVLPKICNKGILKNLGLLISQR